jgi:hypothetical protein
LKVNAVYGPFELVRPYNYLIFLFFGLTSERTKLKSLKKPGEKLSGSIIGCGSAMMHAMSDVPVPSEVAYVEKLERDRSDAGASRRDLIATQPPHQKRPKRYSQMVTGKLAKPVT